MLAKPHSCSGCSLEHRSTGYIPPIGNPLADIVLVGEAGGEDEARQGEPFVGQAGGMLNRLLSRNLWDRSAFRIDNVCRCRPPNNWYDERAPYYTQSRQQCVAAHLSQTLAEPHKVVVALGGTALKTLLGIDKGIRVEDWHGTVTRLPSGQLLVPTFHPSFLSRGATNLFGVVCFDLQVAHRAARDGWQPDPAVAIVDPPPDWFEAWVSQVEAIAQQDPAALWLAVDIETPDKSGGQDEGALSAEDTSYQILRVNFSVHPDEGVTVPYAGPYVALVDRLLGLPCPKLGWNFEYDRPRLESAGHQLGGDCFDFMWAAHHLQSDVPLGLGFWAPFYSRYGAYKHLAASQPGLYAACDGFQTYRTAVGIASDLETQGMWHAFERHTHRVHRYALRPAQQVGVKIDVPKLQAFVADLEVKQRRLLHEMQGLVPPELRPLTPKAGLKRPPAEGSIHTKGRAEKKDGTKKKDVPDPIKQELYALHATTVHRRVLALTQCCNTCGAVDVGAKHRCTAGAAVVLRAVELDRWFWQEPFNPDSPDQILAYLKAKSHKPGRAKKTGADSTDAETLKHLLKETKDPLYGVILKTRAVGKVKGTYGVGTLRRLDAEGRVHPVPTYRPSTHRLCVAAGTPIEIARDVAKYPKGIPIEEVQPGMFAYTFDEERQLHLRRVLWVGQTGTRQVLRIHWVAGWGSMVGKFGYVDLTPEHEVRLVDGTYRQAQHLQQGDKTLAMTRGFTAYGYQRIWATGHKQLNEHRFIFEETTGETAEHVHHVNHQRLDNRPENLEGLDASAHTSYHGALQPTPRQRAARSANMLRLREAQRTGHARPIQPFRLNLTKEWLTQVLIAAGGRPTYVAKHYGIDYTTLMKYVDQYGIPCARKRRKSPKHNHVIVFVERLLVPVDVYDLEVEGTHNFIANEVCVHNSYRSPNITNVVADKGAGAIDPATGLPKENLAGGFRACVVASGTDPDWAEQGWDARYRG